MTEFGPVGSYIELKSDRFSDFGIGTPEWKKSEETFVS